MDKTSIFLSLNKKQTCNQNRKKIYFISCFYQNLIKNNHFLKYINNNHNVLKTLQIQYVLDNIQKKKKSEAQL